MKTLKQLIDQLECEGKVHPLIIDPEQMDKMNRHMEEVKRDSRRKQAESALLARFIILTD